MMAKKYYLNAVYVVLQWKCMATFSSNTLIVT